MVGVSEDKKKFADMFSRFDTTHNVTSAPGAPGALCVVSHSTARSKHVQIMHASSTGSE